MEFKDKNNKIEYKKYQGIYIYIYTAQLLSAFSLDVTRGYISHINSCSSIQARPLWRPNTPTNLIGRRLWIP